MFALRVPRGIWSGGMPPRALNSLAARMLLISVSLVGLPLLGAATSGRPLAPLFRFPPQRTLQHADFAWSAFVLIGVLFALMLVTIIALVGRDQRRRRPPVGARHWPWWLWPGLLALLSSWTLTWTRFDWFAPFQAYTFIPLWLAYIVLIDAIAFRLGGTSLIAHRPRFLAGLFPLSALFWWYFEYPNRYVQNWMYTGVSGFTSAEYVLYSTLAFATVLPAVMATHMLWRSILRPPPRPIELPVSRYAWRRAGIALLATAALVLFSLRLLPNYLFPFLWIAPLLLLLGFQGLEDEPALLRRLRLEGWQALYLPALAALSCGFFWELWNYYSYAKWTYSIPFVDRFHLFEMPVLGYAGYPPFGLECMAMALLLNK